MRGRPLPRVPVLALAVVACESHSTSPDAVLVAIQSPRVVTLFQGETRRLAIRVQDAGGSRIDAPADAAWTSSEPDAVRIDPTGEMTALAEWGAARVIVDLVGLRDSIDVWVQPADDTPSTFTMTLVFDDEVPEGWREAACRLGP